MKRVSSFSPAAAAATVVFLSLGTAEARADIKTFNAGSCNAGSLRSTIFGAKNVSYTKTAVIWCPLVRDNTTAKPAKIEVSVVDNSTNLVGDDGNIKCRALTVNRFGTVAARGRLVSTSGTSPAGAILNLPTPAQVYPDGTLTVHCVIPRRAVGNPPSGVASIKLVEPD